MRKENRMYKKKVKCNHSYDDTNCLVDFWQLSAPIEFTAKENSKHHKDLN